MNTEIPYPKLRAAVRALRRYTAPHSPLLYLHTDGATLTLTASTGAEIAQIDLPGALAAGRCAVPADQLARALTLTRPAGRGNDRPDRTATVSLGHTAATLHLSGRAGQAGAASLPATDPLDFPAFPDPPTVAAVADGPVTALCDLLVKVSWAAARGEDDPLAVVRLVREPGAVLLAEATDRYRAHRAAWGQPCDVGIDARMPAAAVRRAVQLMTSHARGQQLTIDADPHRIRWHTPTVRIAAYTSSEPFPNLDAARTAAHDAAQTRLTVDRPALLAVLEPTARRATISGATVALEARPADGALNVLAIGTAGEPTVRHRLTATNADGPAHTLPFEPTRIRDAVAFLDHPTVDITAGTGHTPVCLAAGDRHAILVTTRPT